jgi:hypothetical protein
MPPPHGVAASIPAIEIADDADRARIRRPDRECHAPGLRNALHMGAESMPSLQVVAFGEKMDVEVAENRRKRIGIVEIVRLVAPIHSQAVCGRALAGDPADKDAAVLHIGKLGDGMAGAVDDLDGAGARLEGAQNQALLIPVQAKKAEGIGVIGGEDGLNVVGEIEHDAS